jgi:phosphohistidine phosphatase
LGRSRAGRSRPATERAGQRSAPRIGAWLAAQGLAPDAVLCSTARRTRETWDGYRLKASRRARAGLQPWPLPRGPGRHAECDPGFRRHASGGRGPQSRDRVARLVALRQAPPQHPKFGLYPTGATLILIFDGDHMSDIAPGQGQVEGFAVPREMPDPD